MRDGEHGYCARQLYAGTAHVGCRCPSSVAWAAAHLRLCGASPPANARSTLRQQHADAMHVGSCLDSSAAWAAVP